MRAGPIGLHAEIATVLDAAQVQARITHDTPAGVASAQAAALAVHHFARQLGSPDELADFVDEHVSGPWRAPWRGRVRMHGIDCVHAAISAIGQTTSLSELLHRCVAFGGDVDTVATIALAAACWSKRHEADLPTALVDGLERGPYGHDFLIELDARLAHHMLGTPDGRSAS